jgi:hypothetical protein
MKSFQMKALALATLGLGGLVMAGGAFAACPTGVAQADGGAWSGKNVVAGAMTVVPGGLESPTPSACAMSSVITSFNPFAAAAAVDNSPQNEVTYRAQFLINAGAIVNLGPFNSVQIFGANAANSASTNNPTTQILKMTLSGSGANNTVNFIAACSNGSNDRCSTSAPLAAGVNRIEIQIIMGSGTGAQLNYWINNTNSASPTGSIQAALGVAGFDNSAWVGVKAAVLGLINPTNGFMTGGSSQLNHAVLFDAFDSRRQTFIGG